MLKDSSSASRPERGRLSWVLREQEERARKENTVASEYREAANTTNSKIAHLTNEILETHALKEEIEEENQELRESVKQSYAPVVEGRLELHNEPTKIVMFPQERRRLWVLPMARRWCPRGMWEARAPPKHGALAPGNSMQ